MKRPIRVCYVAGREKAYSRSQTMIKALGRGGFEVVTCLPGNKAFRNYPKIIWEFLKKKKRCDLILVGFYGQILLPIIWAFTRKPILFDLYITTFGTMVHDRGAAEPGSLKARVFWLLDRIAMQLAKTIIIETRHHINEYSKTFRIPEEKFKQVFLSLDTHVLHPRTFVHHKNTFLVHFHGEYAPFHGVEFILKAAHLLRDEDVQFQIIGKGITWREDMQLARELGLRNCRFIDWVPYEELADYMSRAQVCLGIFGENPRTSRVLTNKVIEAIAVGCPLVTARNESVQELLKDGQSAILVDRANPEAIASAIRRLMKDSELRNRIGRAGYEVFLRHCTLDIFSKNLRSIITQMVTRTSGSDGNLFMDREG